jgi:hypothetical protein
MGIDFVAIDWTNNLWDKKHWDERAPNVQQLCNATSVAMNTWAAMRYEEGIDVPQVLFLLGLDNGPMTTEEAIMEEMDWINDNYVAKWPEMFIMYEERPLIVVFDGTGANHTSFAHPKFTTRYSFIKSFFFYPSRALNLLINV